MSSAEQCFIHTSSPIICGVRQPMAPGRNATFLGRALASPSKSEQALSILTTAEAPRAACGAHIDISDGTGRPVLLGASVPAVHTSLTTHLASRCKPGSSCSWPAAEADSPASEQHKVLPFASLGLPSWALELAKEATEDIDEDCRSWYTSPASSPPTSPRCTPRGTARHAASVDDSAAGLRSQDPPGKFVRKVCWADIAEEDDEWSSDLMQPSGSLHSTAVGFSEKVRWADLEEDEEPTFDSPWLRRPKGGVGAAAILDGETSTEASSDQDEESSSSASTSPVLEQLAPLRLVCPSLSHGAETGRPSWAALPG